MHCCSVTRSTYTCFAVTLCVDFFIELYGNCMQVKIVLPMRTVYIDRRVLENHNNIDITFVDESSFFFSIPKD